MGLSLSACSTAVIKTNANPANLEQKAINGINAMYEYPSYDYRGKFNIHVDQDQSTSTTNIEEKVLDLKLKQKVDQYLQAQKVSLNAQQKQALYTALASQPHGSVSSKADRFAQMMTNILNDMQFEFDGSVHYRQKMGSLNLTARYEKPTLLVQAKVPMVLDLKSYKFYVNYFALMPYLVNQESQNNLAYLDFSKFQNELKQVEMGKFVDYIKASSAVYYRLADQGNVQAIAVSSQDKAVGAVEKIRLKTSVEELVLQADLYGRVNQSYLTQQILHLKDSHLDQTLADSQAMTEVAKTSTVDLKEAMDDASVVSDRLYDLVNQHLQITHTDNYPDDVDVAPDEAEDDTQHTAEDVEQASEASNLSTVEGEQDGLTRTQCVALQGSATPRYGDVQYCQSMYALDVLSDQNADSGTLSYFEKLHAVEQVFAQYDQKQFIDDQAFKALWSKHQTEIKNALPPIEKRNPLMMDVAIDEKGRVVKIDYDLGYTLPEFKSHFNVKMDMQVLNYGKATPIDQAQLKHAKSWAEASKGSILERLVGHFSQKLGQTEIQDHSTTSSAFSLDDQLHFMAEQRYDTTHSYAQTYTAIFIAKLIEKSPQIVQRYSSQELQDIASVYAYWYSDESIYNPQGQALETIKALQQKHHLKYEDQFDDRLGQDIYRIVSAAMQGAKDREAWKKLQTQYKQPQQLFAKQYQIQFEQESTVYPDEKELLEQTANILGKVYVDARQNKLSEQSIQSLKPEHNSFIDYAIFKDVYQKMLDKK